MAAVFVAGFDFDTPDSVIERHFSAVGEVTDVRQLGRGGSAVVTYGSMADANRAVTELHETTMDGNRRYCSVRLDEKGGKGKGKGKGGKSKGKGFSDSEPFDGDLQDGTVASFLEDRGFGFITPDDGGSDVYVHFSAIKADGYRTLHQGQAVRFGIGEDPKGKSKGKGKAVHVELC